MTRTLLMFLTVTALAAGVLSGCGEDEGPGSWRDAPVVPDMSGETRASFLADVASADAHGYQPNVFAKVGDSNTRLPWNLYGFGCRPVEYGDQDEYEPVVERYDEAQFQLEGEAGCDPITSFSRLSSATRSGTYSVFPVTKIKDYTLPFGAPDPACGPEEIPVDCEIRLIRPRYTFVMTGTNDLVLDPSEADRGRDTASRIALVVERIRQAGSVPILSNLPPIWVPSTPEIDEWGGVQAINERIQGLADEENVPLINLWGALTEEQMIDHGLGEDGVHMGVYGGADSPDLLQNSVNLSDEALRYGANRRNLIWLQTLAELDRVAAEG